MRRASGPSSRSATTSRRSRSWSATAPRSCCRPPPSRCCGPGAELVTPWPSYPLYPLMASRAGARPVPVDLSAGSVSTAALLAGVGERTRAVVLCNPNDPTGTYLPADELGALAGALPADVPLLLDEAFVQFQDVEEEDACPEARRAFPRRDRVPHVLEDLRALGPARRLRGGLRLGRRAARRARPGARGERPHAGRRGAGLAHRGRRGAAPPPARDRAAHPHPDRPRTTSPPTPPRARPTSSGYTPRA